MRNVIRCELLPSLHNLSGDETTNIFVSRVCVEQNSEHFLENTRCHRVLYSLVKMLSLNQEKTVMCEILRTEPNIHLSYARKQSNRNIFRELAVDQVSSFI